MQENYYGGNYYGVQPAAMPNDIYNRQLPQQMSYQAPNATVIWINGGEKEALMYPIGPNRAVALWDQVNGKIYLKIGDPSGRPMITTYSVVKEEAPEQVAEPSVNYVTQDQFAELTKALGSIQKDFASIKQDLYGIAGKPSKQEGSL